MLFKTEQTADRSAILRNLPVFPAVAIELIDFIDTGAADSILIGKLLGRDPALSAEVLRQANSVRFARRRQVNNLDDAVTLLGTHQTCRIATQAACRGLVAPALGRPELRSCWEHSVASAILASSLAPELGQKPGSAYTAGLLHDIGCLALVAVYPDRYVEAIRLMRQGVEWLEAERQIFGVHHCTVGRWVLEDWRLPDELLDVVVHHHDTRAFDRSMVTLVAMSSIVADLIQPHPMEKLSWADPAAYLATLPLDDPERALALVLEVSERIETELQ